MKIESSQVSLTCEHVCVYSSERSVDKVVPAGAATTPAAVDKTAADDNFRLLFRDRVGVLRPSPAAKETSSRGELRDLLQEMIERLWAMLCRVDSSAAPASQPCEPRSGRRLATAPTTTPGDAPEGLRRISIRSSEFEATRVAARGEVRTADGRRLDFDLQLGHERSFSSTTSSVEAARPIQLKDPLVLEFAGPAAVLSGKKFRFDLDADGAAESLPALAAGTAFLVFDRNANGRADDGRELFGAASGDGFADLARHDADGNGWIDEADPDFERLRLWHGDAGGPLQTLAAAGVGAIHVGRVDSPFALKDAAGELLGQIRQSGVWLAEDGRAGGVRQLDLALQPDQDAAAAGKREASATG